MANGLGECKAAAVGIGGETGNKGVILGPEKSTAKHSQISTSLRNHATLQTPNIKPAYVKLNFERDWWD